MFLSIIALGVTKGDKGPSKGQTKCRHLLMSGPASRAWLIGPETTMFLPLCKLKKHNHKFARNRSICKTWPSSEMYPSECPLNIAGRETGEMASLIHLPVDATGPNSIFEGIQNVTASNLNGRCCHQFSALGRSRPRQRTNLSVSYWESNQLCSTENHLCR